MSPAKQRVEIDGRTLAVSNLEKVLFPEVGVTKAQVIDYYVRIAPVLLPHLAGRPVTFTRWPDGVEGQTFFEKNSARHAPEWVRRVTIPSPGSSTGRETLDMVVLESVADLAWAANLAALELHVPQWQVDDDGVPQLPDLLVLDLDPGPDTGLAECCAVAERLGERLEADGLDPVVKTSGSKGMQVYAPIEAADREHPSRYAKALAQELSAETPDDVVWRMEKVLRPGKVLIDWSQNNPAKTTVAPYSLRARAGATVSTPIGWDEVDAVREGADPATLRFTHRRRPRRGSRSTATCSTSPTPAARRCPRSESGTTGVTSGLGGSPDHVRPPLHRRGAARRPLPRPAGHRRRPHRADGRGRREHHRLAAALLRPQRRHVHPAAGVRAGRPRAAAAPSWRARWPRWPASGG